MAEADFSTRANAFVHLRKSVPWLACGGGNAVYWLLDAGFYQTIVLNACCLLIQILRRQPSALDFNGPGATLARRALLIFSLQTIAACDVVSVLIDQLSYASLY